MKKEEGKTKKESWKYELARDTLAIGGLVFYLMFIARAIIAPYYDYALQLITALIIFQILILIIKDTENHIGRGFIAAFFTIIFYNVQSFTIFAFIVYIFVIISAIYLQKTKAQITKGLILGIVSTALAYYLVPYLTSVL